MRNFFLIAIALSSITFFNGGCYLAKQGVGLVRYQSQTKPIDKMLKDSSASKQMKDFLLQVGDIRAFAFDSLGLKRNKNYTKYLQVGRGYAADVVVASKDDSFDLYRWWFPIVGTISYKGFFDKKDAEKEARKIEKRGGYDIHIGRADAFSTLGVFSDPIYSFMIDYSVYDLASLIIHEQTHATVFLKNQTQLNEEIATFVGDVGGLLYVKERFGEGSEQYREAVLSKGDYEAYIGLMRSLHYKLKVLYDSDSSREQKLAGKERIFAEFRESLSSDSGYDSIFKTKRFEGLKGAKLNNAVIAARMTYNLDMSMYYELYERRGGDLRGVVEDLKGLKKVKKNHKEYLRQRR